jgi:hypothetical protein
MLNTRASGNSVRSWRDLIGAFVCMLHDIHSSLQVFSQNISADMGHVESVKMEAGRFLCEHETHKGLPRADW